VIGRGLRRLPHLIETDCVTVDANLLSRRALNRAIAVVAGRASEQLESVTTGKSERDFRPASRAEALKQGRLILVAEDNETNRKVILRQLSLLGYAADVADNGLQALQYWLKGDYALLLTDLHMPGMDGYQITETIRLEEESGRPRIPIIALTANALRSEADRCRAAGMDDYLSKPAQLADLKAALERWMPQAGAVRIPPAEPRPTPLPPPGAPMDISVLEHLVGDDPVVVRDFLDVFRHGAVRGAADMREAFAAGELMRGGAEAHKLKSSARSVGALALGELCAELELASAARDADGLNRLLAAFDAEFDRVEHFLDAMPEQGSADYEKAAKS
jgi:CheY-like chemotaxis protein/HPt (histidine-containing phosphotransfer) domain-containing protein